MTAPHSRTGGMLSKHNMLHNRFLCYTTRRSFPNGMVQEMNSFYLNIEKKRLTIKSNQIKSNAIGPCLMLARAQVLHRTRNKPPNERESQHYFVIPIPSGFHVGQYCSWACCWRRACCLARTAGSENPFLAIIKTRELPYPSDSWDSLE